MVALYLSAPNAWGILYFASPLPTPAEPGSEELVLLGTISLVVSFAGVVVFSFTGSLGVSLVLVTLLWVAFSAASLAALVEASFAILSASSVSLANLSFSSYIFFKRSSRSFFFKS